MAEFPTAGMTVGSYRIGRVLGSGQIGVTYAAVDLRHPGRPELAVKVMLPRTPLESLAEAAFAAEVEALLEARSTGILVPRDHVQYDGRYVTVTPLFKAGSLQQLLDRAGPLGRGEALAVTAHVARALRDAHRLGVFHGAVKPSNIFPSSRDGALVPMLADFGSVLRSRPWHVPPRGSASSAAGFVPPESVGPKPVPVDARGDVYSLGCLLYALRTGQPPYQGLPSATPDAMPQLPVDDATDSAINALLARALQPDPDHRFATIDEMGARLTELAHAPAAPAVQAEEAETTILPPVREPVRSTPPDPTSAFTPPAAAVVEPPVATATPPASHPDGFPPEPPGPSGSRRVLMLLAVLAAIAAVIVVSVVHKHNLEPHSSPPPLPATSGPAKTSSGAARLPRPKVAARPAYRAVNFQVTPSDSADGARIQVDSGSGWQETSADEVSVPTSMGGERACIKVRAVSEDHKSRTVRRCGTSEAPVMTMVPIGGCRIGTTDYADCYRLHLRGFEPGTLQVASSAPDSEGQTQHYTDPVEIGQDGTGEDPVRFGANSRQTVSVSAAGVDQEFTIGE